MAQAILLLMTAHNGFVLIGANTDAQELMCTIKTGRMSFGVLHLTETECTEELVATVEGWGTLMIDCWNGGG